MRILVVEDDLEQLAIRRQILEHAGYEVAAARNAPEAIAQLDGASVVVMDLRIPAVEDGMGLIRAVSGSARIIALSGADPEVALPVDEFLQKPCSSKRLLEAIAKWTAPGGQAD